MTRRSSPAHGYRSTHVTGQPLRERRQPLIADGKRTPVQVRDLHPADRARFFAQLAAFRAGLAYINAITLNVTYGVPVPLEVVTVWNEARSHLDRLNDARRRDREWG